MTLPERTPSPEEADAVAAKQSELQSIQRELELQTVLAKNESLEQALFNQRKTEPAAKGMSNNDYAANFTDFLDAAPKDAPWCFWYGAHEPHRDYEFQSGVNKGGKKLSDIDRVPDYWPDNEIVRHDRGEKSLGNRARGHHHRTDQNHR